MSHFEVVAERLADGTYRAGPFNEVGTYVIRCPAPVPKEVVLTCSLVTEARTEEEAPTS